jgi:hypothetical protein
MDLKELGIVQAESHWYYSSKSQAIVREVRSQLASNSRLLDVGAGSGYFTQQLVRAFGFSEAVAFDLFYASDQLGFRDGVKFVRELNNESLRGLDLAVFIDVLEHIENPVDFLRDFVKDLDEGTTVLITVPAYMSLWSGHDEFLGHYRRYRLGELTKLVEDSGLHVSSRRYLFCSIFPIVLLKRRLLPSAGSDLRELVPLLNSFLKLVCSLDHRLNWFKVPGLTALVVATKQKSNKPFSSG